MHMLCQFVGKYACLEAKTGSQKNAGVHVKTCNDVTSQSWIKLYTCVITQLQSWCQLVTNHNKKRSVKNCLKTGYFCKKFSHKI